MMQELIERGDEQWDSARAAFNLAIDQRAAMVARPGNAEEVAAVVGYARENGLRVAVQAEGHGAGPLAGLGEDTLLLKTARMAGAEIDAENRRARVGAGAKWQDVSALASPQGLAGLSGSSAEVGVVGYMLGGGHSWLARRHGLACNSMVGAEVVRRRRTALARRPRERARPLLGAARRRRELRGGDGARVRALPRARALRRHVGLALERTADVLHAWREWCSGLPNEMSTWARVHRSRRCPTSRSPFAGVSSWSSRPPTWALRNPQASSCGPCATSHPSSIPSRPFRPRHWDTYIWIPRIPCRSL